MWLVFVVLLLHVSEKLLLKLVDILYVAEDGFQLRLSEHVWVFAALADVTLWDNRNHYIRADMNHGNNSNADQQEVPEGRVEHSSLRHLQESSSKWSSDVITKNTNALTYFTCLKHVKCGSGWISGGANHIYVKIKAKDEEKQV